MRLTRILAAIAALALPLTATAADITAAANPPALITTVNQLRGERGDIRGQLDVIHQRLLDSIQWASINDATVLADGLIFIGDAGNTPAAMAVSGVVATTNGGVFSFVRTNTLGGNPAMGANVLEVFTTGLGGEGATANAFEWLLTATDPTADRTFTFPDNTGIVILQTADTIGADPVYGANGFMIGTTGPIWEGATNDVFETLLVVTDPTADQTLTLPNDTGTLMIITADTIGGNPAYAGNAVMIGQTGIIFEGATANANEGELTAFDVTTDQTWTLPNDTGTVFLVTADTVGGNPGLTGDTFVIGTTGLIGEGATADNLEWLLTATDPTQDNTFTLPDIGGAVMIETADGINPATDTLGGNPTLANNLMSFATTGLMFEGATGGGADANEGLLTCVDPSADRTWTLQDMSGTLIMQTAETIGANPQWANNTVGIGTTGPIWEGATGGAGDAFEALLTVTDPTGDRTFTFPDSSGTVVLSSADGLDPAADTLGGNPALLTDNLTFGDTGLIGEGNTADNNEWLLTATDPTADRTFTFPDNSGNVIMQTGDTIGASPTWANNTVGVGTTGIIWEGATGGGADAFELLLTCTDPTADATITLPMDTGTVFLTTADTIGGNPALAADTFVMGTTGLIGEAASVDDFEWLLTADDATADRTYTLPDRSGDVVIQSADTVGGNPVLAANDVIIGATGPLFEGAAVDDFEAIVVVTDPTADNTFTFPDDSGLIVMQTGETIGGNPAFAGDGISVGDVGIIFEGASADNFETLITPTDPGADVTITLPGTGASGMLSVINNTTAIGPSATPTVIPGVVHYTITQGGATDVTDFLGGVTGMIIIVEAGDGNTTVKDGVPIKSAGDFALAATDTITLLYNGTDWLEVCRSDNT